ncbi:MAG TPA: hypothetical protein VL097_00800, partial [Rhodanobacter sp.]|nr:hypothetical protein [Rhodanobacter sp.]
MQPLDTAVRERAFARAETPDPTGDAENSFALTPPHNPTTMHVTKRNGGHETVDVNKIVRAV